MLNGEVEVSNFTWKDLNFTFETTEDDKVWPCNNEKQGYDNKHASVNENGDLEIKLTKVTSEDKNKNMFKSSRIIMTDKIDDLKLEKGFQISVEFNGKLPTAYNNDGSIDDDFPLWPAFWMMGTGIWDGGFYENGLPKQPWPFCAEIDIMEWAPKNGKKKYTHAIHWEDNGHKYDCNKKERESDTDLRTSFHKYKTIISRTTDDNVSIGMYFDDNLVNLYQINNNTQNEFYQTINSKNEILADEKYYGLLMNLALGGKYTGYEGTAQSIIQEYPNFNNAVLTVKSIVIEKTEITIEP